MPKFFPPSLANVASRPWRIANSPDLTWASESVATDERVEPRIAVDVTVTPP